jgi:hypothetical protein
MLRERALARSAAFIEPCLAPAVRREMVFCGPTTGHASARPAGGVAANQDAIRGARRERWLPMSIIAGRNVELARVPLPAAGTLSLPERRFPPPWSVEETGPASRPRRRAGGSATPLNRPGFFVAKSKLRPQIVARPSDSSFAPPAAPRQS